MTPALGYAANIITVVTIAFFALVMFIFWLGGLGEKGKAGRTATPRAGHRGRRCGPIAGGSRRRSLAMRVPVGVKVGVFSLVVMGTYSYYANSIPQIESKPPQELSLEGGNVTPAQLVKAGEEIFKTKGTCEICHRIGQKGTRAPDLAGIGARAGKTKPGMSAKQYLIESLLSPGAFVVEGYPPIMPAVDKPPIALNRSGVWALTAFLESLGGHGRRHAQRHPGHGGRRRGRGGAPAEVKIPAT